MRRAAFCLQDLSVCTSLYDSTVGQRVRSTTKVQLFGKTRAGKNVVRWH
jgi:hypothetical protein